jgi:hypothetical protein
LTGDAFTHSNTNSPNHLQFVNTTPELPQDPPVQEPPIILVQTPPPTFAAPEQENPPTSTPVIQNDTIPHSEPHTLSPIQEPSSTPQPEPSTPEPEPEPQTLQPEPIYGPSYKPLTVEELILPVDFALPIFEDYLKKQINIDDEPESTSEELTSEKPSIDLRKIKIIPLKRKNLNPPFHLTETISFSIPSLNLILSS